MPVESAAMTQSVEPLSASEVPAGGDIASLLLSHWHGAHLLALRITNDPQAAEDAVQEAFVKALDQARRNPPREVRTWLFRITANQAKDYLRTKQTHQRLEARMRQQQSAPQQKLSEMGLAVREQLGRLDEKYRVALSLHYEQGLTFAEMAAVSDVPEGTAASLVSRGLERLRERLAQDGFVVAPAVVLQELQTLGALTVARPEALLAVKAALGAKAASGTAGTAATTAGAKSLGLLSASAAAAVLLIGVGIAWQLNTAPAPSAVLPSISSTPSHGATPPALLRCFDSRLSFSVLKLDEQGKSEEIGRTPYPYSPGIPLPAGENWCLRPLDRRQLPELVQELKAKAVPALQLDCSIDAALLNDISRLPGLIDLSLYQQAELTDGDLKCLKNLPQLKRLRLSSNGFTPQAVEYIKDAVGLTHLALGLQISDAEAQTLATLKHLQFLSLHSRALTPAGLAPLARLPELRHLNIRGTSIVPDDLLKGAIVLSPSVASLALGQDTAKLEHLLELRQALPKVKINAWRPWAEESEFKRKAVPDEVADVLAAIEAASRDTTVSAPAADSEIREVIDERKIGFEFLDTPVARTLEVLSEHAGVPIVLDPGAPVSDLPTTTLHVTDMSCGLALSWICRLADLEYLISGRIVVVTTAARLAKARPVAVQTLALPMAEREAPWTSAETERFIQVLQEFPCVAEIGADGYTFHAARLQECRQSEPGKLVLREAAGEVFDASFFSEFASPTKRIQVTQDLQKMAPALQAPPRLEKPSRALDKTVSALSSPGLEIVLDPKVAATGWQFPADWAPQGKTVREALLELCKVAGLRLEPRSGGLLLCEPDSALWTVPGIFDLRPALRAGVAQGELEKALSGLLADAHISSAPLSLRGRWLAQTDPWTAERIYAVLDGAAASGKISAPPAPWFFETYRNTPVKRLEPPQPVYKMKKGGCDSTKLAPVKPEDF